MVTFNDAQNPYDPIQEVSVETESNGMREKVTSPNMVEIMRSFNERLIKAQEEQHQINVAILQSLTDIQQKVYNRSKLDNVDQHRSVEHHSKRHTWKRSPSPRREAQSKTCNGALSKSFACTSSNPIIRRNSLEHSYSIPKRRRTSRIYPQGEFRNVRLPTFGRENKTGQEVESWLLGMERYFHIQN